MDNTTGLEFLTWDMFDCPNWDGEGTGLKFMERKPVLLLDEYVRRTGRNLTINLGYVGKHYANTNGLPSNSSHRVGLAVRVKCLNEKFRMQLIAYLMEQGVRRISFNSKEVYFDCDPLKAPMFNYGFRG
jgi:hypothetical protein